MRIAHHKTRPDEPEFASLRIGRRWIGIDITHLAITLIKKRLRDSFGEAIDRSRATVGEPASLPDPGAPGLAAQDPYQFQWWALGLVDARPVEPKKAPIVQPGRAAAGCGEC